MTSARVYPGRRSAFAGRRPGPRPSRRAAVLLGACTGGGHLARGPARQQPAPPHRRSRARRPPQEPTGAGCRLRRAAGALVHRLPAGRHRRHFRTRQRLAQIRQGRGSWATASWQRPRRRSRRRRRPAGAGTVTRLRDDRYLYAYFTAAADNRIARMRLEEARRPAGAGHPGRSSSPASQGRHAQRRTDPFRPGRLPLCGHRRFPAPRTAAGHERAGRQDPPDHRRTAAPRPATRSATTPSTASATGTSRAWPGTAPGRLWASEFGPDVDDELT